MDSEVETQEFSFKSMEECQLKELEMDSLNEYPLLLQSENKVWWKLDRSYELP